MKENDRFLVSALIVLLLVFWLGFLFHRSPDFAGSLTGGMLAVSGSALMLLVPLTYLVIKRVKAINNRVTRMVPLRTLLTWHIYTSALGAILVILHTGHKFNSPLGVALTAMTLLAVLSGYAGRYLMRQCSQTIREKRELLTRLEIAYRQASGELAAVPERISVLQPFSGLFSQWIGSRLVWDETGGRSTPGRVIALAAAMADMEYSIKMHTNFEVALRWCLKLHLVLALALYLLLALHVWAGIHFGLRWFS